PAPRLASSPTRRSSDLFALIDEDKRNARFAPLRFGQDRHLPAAGWAPGCPQVYHHGLTSKVCEGPVIALHILQLCCGQGWLAAVDRKSTRLNSSHVKIS